MAANGDGLDVMKPEWRFASATDLTERFEFIKKKIEDKKDVQIHFSYVDSGLAGALQPFSQEMRVRLIDRPPTFKMVSRVRLIEKGWRIAYVEEVMNNWDSAKEIIRERGERVRVGLGDGRYVDGRGQPGETKEDLTEVLLVKTPVEEETAGSSTPTKANRKEKKGGRNK